MQPLVSILIPCYNAEKWLAETLESALAQTWQNIEIIVVDDGSTDASLSVAHRFASSRVSVISQPNSGAAVARNRALKQCQGDFIQYLDADDLLAPDKIERQIHRLIDNNLDCVASGAWARFFRDPEDASFTPQPLWQDLTPVDWLICAWEGHWMMHPAAWLVPRAIADQADIWNEALTLDDDGEYFCRVVLASQQVLFCAAAKTYYRSGLGNSLSGSTSDAAWRSLFQSIELGKDQLLAKEHSDRTRHACATRFQRFIYEVFPAAPDLEQKAKARVRQLGGANLKPVGGPAFQRLSALVGWRWAKRIQKRHLPMPTFTGKTLQSIR